MRDGIGPSDLHQRLPCVPSCHGLLLLVRVSFGLRPIRTPRATARSRPSPVLVRNQLALKLGEAGKHGQDEPTMRL